MRKDLTILYFHRSRVISGMEGKGRGGGNSFQTERDRGITHWAGVSEGKGRLNLTCIVKLDDYREE